MGGRDRPGGRLGQTRADQGSYGYDFDDFDADDGHDHLFIPQTLE